MLRVPHQIDLPWAPEAVLAQYHDLEHIAHVHPDSVGSYEDVAVGEDGRTLTYTHRWPSWLGWRARSRVRQVYVPPDRIDFAYVGGFLRGVQVLTRLEALETGTRVHEVYVLPWLPGWGWVQALMGRVVAADVRRIWGEDRAVGLPRGGWPEVPGVPEAPPPWDGSALVVGEGPDRRVWQARCPHAGGPLRCRADGTEAVCPWHGARFRLADGRKVSGPGPERLEGVPGDGADLAEAPAADQAPGAEASTRR